MQRFHQLPDNLKGAAFLMMAAFGFSLMSLIIKLLGMNLRDMQILPEQLDQQRHQRKADRGQHQECDAFRVIGQTMEPVQAMQPFMRLEAVAINPPLRKKIAGPDGCAALSPIPARSAKNPLQSIRRGFI